MGSRSATCHPPLPQPIKAGTFQEFSISLFMCELLDLCVITDTFSVEEQRENPRAVMDALQVFDKKLREPMGQKYMGARSVEDLSTEPGTNTKQQSSESAADANGLPALPPKAKDLDGNKSPTDKQVCSEDVCVLCYFLLVLFLLWHSLL